MSEHSDKTPEKTPDNSITYSCPACEKPDADDNLVVCDQCKIWWHYTCAGVTESVKQRKWYCSKCFPQPTKSISNASSSASRKARLELNMQRLAEQRELEKKQLELELEKKYLKEKYKLMEDSLLEEVETRSVRSWIDEIESRNKQVTVWVENLSAPLVVPLNPPNNHSSVPEVAPVVPVTSTEEGAVGGKQGESSVPPVTPQIDVLRRLEQKLKRQPTLRQIQELQEQLQLCQLQLQRQSMSVPSQPADVSKGAIPKVPLADAAKKSESPTIKEAGQPKIQPRTNVPSPPVLPGVQKDVQQRNQLSDEQQQGHFINELLRNLLANEQRQNRFAPGQQRGQPANEQRPNRFAPEQQREQPANEQWPNRFAPEQEREQPANEQRPNRFAPGQQRERPTKEQRQNPFAPGQQRNQPWYEQQRDQFAPSHPNHPGRQPILDPFPAANSTTIFQEGPFQEQLAARQVMPRDLPVFSGDPEEWPMFVCSYNNTTSACGYNNAENLSRLQRCLKGAAFKSVRYYLMSPESVPDVMRTLHTLYGRPEMIIGKLIRNVRETPPPKPEKLETLIEFGMAIRNLTQHLIAAGQQAHLSNPILLQELVEKLPAGVKLQWAQHLQNHPVPTLQIFSEFMTTVVDSVSKVVVYVGGPTHKNEKSRGREKGFVHAHTEASGTSGSQTTPKRCPVCSKEGHRVADCTVFKRSSTEDRWKTVTALKLCRTCLNFHGRRACRNTNRCGINGCEFRHHSLLHTNPSSPSTSGSPGTNQATENHTYHHCGQSVLFRIIPIVLHGASKSLKAFAFLDEGSSATLIEHNLAGQLGIEGPNAPLCLKWTANMSRLESESQLISLDVSGIGQQNRYHLTNVRTVESLNLPSQTLRFGELQRNFHHLSGLSVQSYENATPRLLIGLRDLGLAVPQEMREGDRGPIATKTRLGWCVYGSLDSQHKAEHVNYHICEYDINGKFDALMREYFNADYVGAQPIVPLDSEENKRSRRILEETTSRVGDRFQTGLIWRYDETDLPDSFPMALQRLKCLERRMQRDEALKENLHRQIREYQEKGYAHRATEEELLSIDPKRVWYLPVNAVTNPNKPGKVRLVWDAAAKVGGISLNSLLLSGPDLLVPLPHVLFHFRQFPVAVSGDIREMFHQMRIIEPDRHFLRFLWRDSPDQPPQIYIMDVAIFGATCSPSSAQFVKNKNAEEFAEQYPRAANDIIKSHYVDDYLTSFETVEEAKAVAENVKVVHSKGGFEIRNWASNSQAVLDHLGGASAESVKELNLAGGGSTERVLGMLWQSADDKLSFSTTFRKEIALLIASEERPTKRQILKCIMSLFDPLGLLASFLVHGKIMMQEVWRSKIQWDERVSDHIYSRWKKWIALFSQVREIHIPRCYFQNASASMYETLEIHVFVDASEDAYTAVVYFRVEAQDGTIQCALVAAKTKVAPIQHATVPRLELMAALLGVRIANFVVDGHSVPVRRRVFWSDSRTVLAWVGSEHRRYRQFVACRVGEILSSTNAKDWRWVPSKLNVADEATKWGKGPCFDASSRWFHGPQFLYLDEKCWPQPVQEISSTDEELRPCHVHQVAAESLIEFERFSNWFRLLRSVAYVRRFVNACRRKIQAPFSEKILTQSELQDAENLIWRIVQLYAYTDEITIIQNNERLPVDKHKPMEKSSVLFKLTPILDARGVLRVDGRIGALQVASVDQKRPIILPRHHHVTFLVVDSYHRKYLHANSETIVNEVRQRFYVPRLRVLVKTVTNRCQWCKIKKSRPSVPRMAPLPAARLSPYVRPFSYVGLDYFGPITVKVGRTHAKRWIALFTCLTVRAVHVEVAFDLSTQSCICCIRRFVARRGAPIEIYSDNGRNFTGAERILAEQVRRIHEVSAVTFTNAFTKWVFIPPSAPHMGGSWERLVRSIKIAMSSLPQERKFDDEALYTITVEAEAIVNSRPLTYLPLDAAEHEALTPNHFLLGSSSGVKQPAMEMISSDTAVCSSWHMIQHNLDLFWKRWVRKYLPTLTKRTRWFGETKMVQPGDLVVIIDDARRNGWVRGKVLSVTPGKDGRVRQAAVQTSDGVFRRPVSKLAVLEVDQTGKAEPDTHLYGAGDVATGNASESSPE